MITARHLTLAHVCDADELTTVAVKYRGNPVATVTIDHANGFGLRVIAQHSVPYIYNELHLTACVATTIMRAFTADHELYSDIFADDEGNAIDLPLLDPTSDE